MALTPQKHPILPNAKGLRFAIVASRYNAEYVDGMLCAAEEIFVKAHAKTVKIVRVPGSFEIPVACAHLARSEKFHAVVALGVIFEGETYHAEHIGTAISNALMGLAVETGVPHIHEVLVLKNKAQAKTRCLDPRYNRGAEAAITAIQMGHTIAELEG